jgi:CIC family chloride channel protein
MGAARAEDAPLSATAMFGLALAAGLFGALASIVFRAAIAALQQLMFHGTLGLGIGPEVHLAGSSWGPGVVLVPLVGALVVVLIAGWMGPESRGHGVPEVMNAIYYQGGRLDPLRAGANAVAAAVTLGTGGSAGREGAIVQLGAIFGSTIGQIVRMPPRQRIVLVACGAAAGIAATFNAPLGGLAFAMELLLVSVSARNLALVASASVVATYFGWLYAGSTAAFDVLDVALFGGHASATYQLLLCVPFGLLTGAAAALFVRSIYWIEDRLEALVDHPLLRHGGAMLVVGAMFYCFWLFAGESYVAGAGYASVIDVLRGVLTSPWLLLVLFLGKLLATSLTLGSGASGGVFGPSLLLGATLGAGYGDAIAWLAPGLGIDPLIFAVAGMAGLIGATTSAVVTAVIIVFELTRDYAAVLPMIIVVSLAYVIRVRITPESVYTMRLARRGREVPQGLQAAMTTSLQARDVMNRDFEVVELSRLPGWARVGRPPHRARYTVVAYNGMVNGLAREYPAAEGEVDDPEALVERRFVVVKPSTRWAEIMRLIKLADTELVIVTRGDHVDDVAGMITSREFALAARDNAELMD